MYTLSAHQPWPVLTSEGKLMTLIAIWSSGSTRDRQAHPLWNMLCQHWDGLKTEPQVELSIELSNFGANRLEAAHCDSYGRLIVRAESDATIEDVLGEWPYMKRLKDDAAAKAAKAAAIATAD